MCGCGCGRAGRSGLGSNWSHTVVSGDAARSAGGRRPAMIVCRNGAGSLCPSGESPHISTTRRGGGGGAGAAAELAGDRGGVWDELGGGVSLGGMVGGVGFGPPGVTGGGVAGRGRDSLGPRFAREQLPDRDLPDRPVLPAPAVGRETAVPGDAATGAEGAGAGGGERIALCLQRQVESLFASDRGPSRASLAGTGPFPYHDAFESGGGSGAARRKHPLPGGEPAEGAAPQAPALAAAAPGQPRPRAGATKTQRAAGQQAGYGTGLGAQGNLLPFLGLPICDLGGSLS